MGGNLKRVGAAVRRCCTSSQIAELSASVVLMQGASSIKVYSSKLTSDVLVISAYSHRTT